MAEKKVKFNIMDALILLAILAVAALLLYIFVFSEGGGLGESDAYTLTYVVAITQLNEEFAERVAIGDAVVDSSKKLPIGTVVAVEKHPHEYLGENTKDGSLTLSTMEGYCDLYVTVEAPATLNGISYTIGGYEIRVGSKVYLSFANLVSEGHCISLSAAQ